MPSNDHYIRLFDFSRVYINPEHSVSLSDQLFVSKMNSSLKLFLIYLVVFNGDFIFGSSKVHAAVNRPNEIKRTLAALRTLLSTTASQDQLNQLKTYTKLCAAKSGTAIQSLFTGNLFQFIGTILNPIGRRKREAASVQQQNQPFLEIDASKEPQTRTQDINAIIKPANKTLNKFPSDILVLSRKFMEGVAGNFLVRGPVLIILVSSTSVCANAKTTP